MALRPLLPHASHLPLVLLRRGRQPLRRTRTSFSVSEGALSMEKAPSMGRYLRDCDIPFPSPTPTAVLPQVSHSLQLWPFCATLPLCLSHICPPPFQRWQQAGVEALVLVFSLHQFKHLWVLCSCMAVTRVTGPLGMCSHASRLSDGEPETCCHRDLSDVPIKQHLQYYGPPYPLLASLLLFPSSSTTSFLLCRASGRKEMGVKEPMDGAGGVVLVGQLSQHTLHPKVLPGTLGENVASHASPGQRHSVPG